MKKAILIQLGSLHDLKRQVHNQWVDNNYNEDARKKLDILAKIAFGLEQQHRGKLKTKVDYSKIAEYVIANILNSDSSTVLLGISQTMRIN